jgi:hypothetical protein
MPFQEKDEAKANEAIKLKAKFALANLISGF